MGFNRGKYLRPKNQFDVVDFEIGANTATLSPAIPSTTINVPRYASQTPIMGLVMENAVGIAFSLFGIFCVY